MFNGLRSLVLFALVIAVLVARPAQADNEWIIDTDMGVDDWAAILYMLHNENTSVVAITVSGNGLSRCPIAGENARRLIALAELGKDIPVACGSIWPLEGFNSYPGEWRDDADRFLGLADFLPPVPEVDAQLSASGFLAKVLDDASEPVSILAIGAMTNIAKVIEAKPQTPSKIEKIVALAGAVDVPGNVQLPGFTEGNPDSVAEWNVFIDPLSAKKVMKSGIPITLVPLDATNHVPLTSAFIESLKATNTPSAKFLAAVYGWIESRVTTGNYFQWDPLAAVVSQTEALCDMEKHKLTVVADTVVTEPTERQEVEFPVVNWRGEARKVIDPETGGGLIRSPNAQEIDVCKHVETARFEAEFIRVIGQ